MKLNKQELILFFGNSVQAKGKNQKINIEIGSTALGGRKIEVKKGEKTAEISINELIKSLQNVKNEFKGKEEEFNKIVTDLKSIDKEATEQFNANVDKKFFSGVIKIFHSIRHLFGKISLKSRDKALEKLPFEKIKSKEKSKEKKPKKESKKTEKSEEKTKSKSATEKSNQNETTKTESKPSKKSTRSEAKPKSDSATTKTESKPSKKPARSKAKPKDLKTKTKSAADNKEPAIRLGDPALNKKIESVKFSSNGNLMKVLEGESTLPESDDLIFQERLQTFKEAGINLKQRLLDLYPTYNSIYQRIYHPDDPSQFLGFGIALLEDKWEKSELPLFLMDDSELSEQSVASLKTLRWDTPGVYSEKAKLLIKERIKTLPPSSKQLPDPKDFDSAPLTNFKNIDQEFIQKNLGSIPLDKFEYFNPENAKTFDLTHFNREQIDALCTCLPLSEFTPKQINQVFDKLTPQDWKSLSPYQAFDVSLEKLTQESFQALFQGKPAKSEYIKRWSIDEIQKFGPQLFTKGDWSCVPKEKLATYAKNHFNELTSESFNATFDMKDNAEWARNLLREINISTLLEKKDLLSKEHWSDLSEEQKDAVAKNQYTPLIFESFYGNGEEALMAHQQLRLNNVWTRDDLDAIEKGGFFKKMHLKALNLETKEAFLNQEGHLTKENFKLLFDLPKKRDSFYKKIEADIQSWQGDKLLCYFPFLNPDEKSCLTKEQLLSINPQKLNKPTFNELTKLYREKKEEGDLEEYIQTWTTDNLLQRKELLTNNQWELLTLDQMKAIPKEAYDDTIITNFFGSKGPINTKQAERLNTLWVAEDAPIIKNLLDKEIFKEGHLKAFSPETKAAYLDLKDKITKEDFKNCFEKIEEFSYDPVIKITSQATKRWILSWDGQTFLKYLPVLDQTHIRLIGKQNFLKLDASINHQNLDLESFNLLSSMYTQIFGFNQKYIQTWELDDIYPQKKMLKQAKAIEHLTDEQRSNFKKEELDKGIFEILFGNPSYPYTFLSPAYIKFNSYWQTVDDIEKYGEWFNQNHFLSVSSPILRAYLENHSNKETIMKIFNPTAKQNYNDPNKTIEEHLSKWDATTIAKHLDAIEAIEDADKQKKIKSFLNSSHLKRALEDRNNL